MVTDGSNRLNRSDPTTLPPALSMRRTLANRTILKSALFIGGVFVALIVIGSLFSSGPSQATIDADRQPTTTTTTEPPPVGVFVVHIDNGVLRPSIPTALHRYGAVLETDSLFGGVRIPGLVDSRPAQ